MRILSLVSSFFLLLSFKWIRLESMYSIIIIIYCAHTARACMSWMRHGKCNGKTIYEHYEWTFTSCESQFLKAERTILISTKSTKTEAQLMIHRTKMIFTSAPCSSTRFRHQREKNNSILHSITEKEYPRSRLMSVEDAAAAMPRGAPEQQQPNNAFKYLNQNRRWRCVSEKEREIARDSERKRWT